MKFLLDTCIVSETHKRIPNAHLMEWLSQVLVDDLFISSVTIGELRSGARSARDISQRLVLDRWIDKEVIPAFANHIVGVDEIVADRWGCLLGEGIAGGHTPSVIDSIIGATALSHGMTMVTRNVSDFQFEGLEVLNPFIRRSNKGK